MRSIRLVLFLCIFMTLNVHTQNMRLTVESTLNNNQRIFWLFSANILLLFVFFSFDSNIFLYRNKWNNFVYDFPFNSSQLYLFHFLSWNDWYIIIFQGLLYWSFHYIKNRSCFLEKILHVFVKFNIKKMIWLFMLVKSIYISI